MEGDYFTMTCLMYFKASVGVEPLMTWSGPDPYQAIYTVTNTSVFSGVSFTAHRDMDAAFYQCFTNFTEKGFGGPDAASNIPDWSYTWRSYQIFVACELSLIGDCTVDSKGQRSHNPQQQHNLTATAEMLCVLVVLS